LKTVEKTIYVDSKRNNMHANTVPSIILSLEKYRRRDKSATQAIT